MDKAFENKDAKNGFTFKLWRGERMAMLGFDVSHPEPDLVGFAVDVKAPGEDICPLMNRIAFEPAANAVTGARIFPSSEAPFQKFRWVHFPHDPKPGGYTYTATKMHMPADGVLKKGTSIKLGIPLDPITYAGFLDVGFTRNFASSQAFLDRIKGLGDPDKVGKTIIPIDGEKGLTHKKATKPKDIYEWLGFEAHQLLFDFLDKAVADPKIEIDAFTYDFNEPDILERLKKLEKRLRILIDDSSSKNKKGEITGHVTPGSAESQAARILKASAKTVLRTHFKGLQHNKVFIAKRDGKPIRVLCGSMNHTFRGVYIQANNVLVFDQPDVADLFEQYFEASLADAAGFGGHDLAKKWHLVEAQGMPRLRFCFSPHTSPDLSLNPVRAAIDQATSSVFYNIAFLNQIKSGPTKEAIDRLMTKPVFSYGVSDKAGGLEVKKPDGSTGLVDFNFLAKNAPEPFKSEWSGQGGINVHHKFVVTDFNLPTAKVFTGSCNLSVSGEKGNGDHLIQIDDCKVATGYAIEAVRVFDHLHFRSVMKEAKKTPSVLRLRKPTAIAGKPAWFEPYYVPNSQKQRDRTLFAT